MTVTDENGCTDSLVIEIANSSAIEIMVEKTDADCNQNNGTVSISATGGNGNYEYLWSNGATAPNVENLSPGTYEVSVVDSEGCTENTSVEILNVNCSNLSLSFGSIEASCGSSDGMVWVIPQNGQAPYTYLWDNQTISDTISGLSKGEYGVTVTDATGLTVSGTVTLNQGAVLVMVSEVTDANCGQNNGTASVTIQNGTPPYSYGWSNGSQEAELTNLNEGIYTVSVSDANGCRGTAEMTINSTTALQAQLTVGNPGCGESNGFIEVSSVEGGLPPYTYNWSSTIESNNRIEGLAGGTYAVTIQDENGCQKVEQVTLTNSSNAFSLEVLSTISPICGQTNGLIEVEAIGPTGEVTFQWSNGLSGAKNEELGEGVFEITATDENGCSATLEIELNCTSCNASTLGAFDNQPKRFAKIQSWH